MYPSFVPHRDRLLLRSIDDDADSVIKAPDGSKPRPMKAEICAIGAGCKDSWRLGQPVYHGKYAGSEIELDGQKFTIMLEEEVVGWVPETA